MKALILAAPSSGAGKTTLTLALLRALRRGGVAIGSGKIGPDYIDPAFHAAATERPCVTLDPWAMSAPQLAARARALSGEAAIIEGVMGLFDGAANGVGSTADAAAALGLPVVLALDVAKQAQSAAAVLRGFRDHRSDVTIAGVVLNRVGSPRHEDMLRAALAPLGLPVLGAVPRDARLNLPERHLGLVQASEHEDLDEFLDQAAALVAERIDLEAVLAAMRGPPTETPPPSRLPPLGRRIAVAEDVAFAFCYSHLLADWRAGGTVIETFSPIRNEAPSADADAVFLPGGYPELHAATLANAETFRTGIQAAADRGAWIYGECGGFMTLGESLIDAAGVAHRMLGLLPLTTSFADRRRHLGYRRLALLADGAPLPRHVAGHEFHYASIADQGAAEPLFAAEDATSAVLGHIGLRKDRVLGSFAHIIEAA